MEQNPVVVPPDILNPLPTGIISPTAIPVPASTIPEINFPAISMGGGMGGDINPKDLANSISGYLNDQNNFQRNYAPYTKIGAYDADYTGLNFDRYYNTPDVYSKVGFSPFRNNEQIYNNNMSWWDGFKRSAGQSLVQASVSFKGALPWNAWDGDYKDVEGAKRVERSSAIGMDTRGGAGAWVNNTMMNFGFTYGILAEIAAEEIALFGASFIPGMQGTAAAGTIRNANRLRELFSNVGTVGKAINVTVDFAKQARQVQTIRDFYKAVQSVKVGRVFLPNSIQSIRNITKGVKRGEDLYSLANASKAFGGFYRDVREISAALSESKLEGGMVQHSVSQKLTDKFYAENGRLPGTEEMTEINRYADAAAKETFLWNMPAIYLSNKVVFDKALRGFIPTRVLRQNLSKGMSGKLVFNEMWRKTGGDPVKLVKQTISDRLKILVKPKMWKPKNLTKDFLGSVLLYSKANITEGLQEVYQEAVSPAMEKYYINKYNNPHVWSTKSKWGDFMEASAENMKSGLALEVFASGFVMGGMAHVPQQMMFQYIPEKFFALTNKEEYNTYIKQRDENSKRVVNALNEIIKADPNKYFKSPTQNASAMLNMENEADMANEHGDKLGYHDTVDDMIGEHVFTLVQNGKIDLLKDYLEDTGKLDAKELAEFVGPTDANEAEPAENYSKKIGNLGKYIERIEKQYEHVEERFFNPFDETMINKDTDPELYHETMMNRVGLERMKKLAVLSDFHYGRTVERMGSIYKNWLTNPVVSGMNATDLSLLFAINPKYASPGVEDMLFQTGTGSLVDELSRLKREVEILNKSDIKTDEGKKELAQKKKQYEILSKYQELINVQYMPTLKEQKAALAQGNEEEAQRKEEALEGIVSRLKDVYSDYILFVAEKSNLNPQDLTYTDGQGKKKVAPAIEDAFRELLDFYTLTNDRSDLVQAVNMLHNPEIMMVGAKSMARIAELEQQQFQQNMTEWWDKWQGYTDGNAILDELSKAGIFFDPKYLDDFKNGRLNDIVFYYHNEGKFFMMRDLKEPQYSQVRDAIEAVLDKYAMMKGLTGRPIFGFRPEGGFTYGSRGKMKIDQRTFADLAKEFGFNTQSAETPVPIKDVLQKVIDSKYSTTQERLLAARLMDIVPEVLNVRFRIGQSLPGSYSESTGIIIDPRYSSSDYKGGGDPIEVNILQQVVKSVIETELQKDTAFKTKIAELLQAARDFQAKNMGDYARMVGLKDEIEFVAAALANPSFQSMLGQAEYQTTGKSAWEEFMTALRDFLSKVFKANKDGSILEEAMYVITAKLSTGPIEGGGQQAPTVTPTPTTSLGNKPGMITAASTVAEMKPIWEPLLKAYKDSEDRRENDNYPPLNFEWRTMSDEDILNSEGFAKFLETKVATDIILDYNEKQGFIKPIVGDPSTKLPTMEQREKLKALDWTPEQIATLSMVDAADVIARGQRGTEDAEREAWFRKLEMETIKKLVQNFYDEYNSIDPQAEGARQALFDWLAGVKEKDRLEHYLANGINSTLWEKMFNDKLALLPKIDSLEMNKIYKVNGVLYKVVSLTENSYVLVKFDELGVPEEQRSKPLTISKDKLNAMNIISAEIAEEPTIVDSEAAKAIDNNAQSITNDQKDEASKTTSSNIDDLGFNPCG